MLYSFARKFDKHYGTPDEKLFKSPYWTYSKVPIKAPLTKLSISDRNAEDICKYSLTKRYNMYTIYGNLLICDNNIRVKQFVLYLLSLSV